MTHCVFLMPVCNRDLRHVSDELVYRDQQGQQGSMLSLTSQSARACSSAFFEIGLHKLVGNRQLIVTVTTDVVDQLDIMALHAGQIIVRMANICLEADAEKNAVAAIRNKGFSMLFNIAQAERQDIQGSDLIELSMDSPELESKAAWAKTLKCRMLIKHVQHAQDFERACLMGFDWMQGPFFSDVVGIDSPLKSRKGNLSAQMILLQELLKAEPDINRLENLLAQDPHLVLLVLRQANNRVRNRTTDIVSIKQASMLLGFDHLKSMITQLLLANNHPLCSFQLKRMMVRAAMCRRLAHRLHVADPSEAFSLGLFSLMDKYLGIAMSDLTDLIPFTQRFKDALLQRTGDLGHLIKLVESFESAQTQDTQHHILDMLNAEYLESLAWMEQVYVSDASQPTLT